MAASQTVPGLRPNRRGVVAQWFALIGAAVAIAAIVMLIVTWPHHGGDSAKATGPTQAVSKQVGKTAAPTSAAVKPRD